jgi:histidinol-phosphate aminotransferase
MPTIDDTIASLVRPEIRALKAYHVPDARGLVKLDAMENPYAWPEAMKDAWLSELRRAEINRYPDPAARALKGRLHEALGVPAGAELLLGNGSDELIQMILMALARPGAVVSAPTPTFVMYEMIATFTGMKFAGVPLGRDFALDLDAMLTAIEEYRPAAIFLACPNNPTGNLFDSAAIETLLREATGLVIVDEAYHAFAQESFLERLPHHDNLLVLRTLSKQGLAGLRLGILAGRPEWLAEFDKVRLPYNLGTLNQASAEFALRHAAVLEEQAARIRAERERLAEALRALPGLEVWPSLANFILFRTKGRGANEVFEALRRGGVLIKNLSPQGGVLAGCLRVTVGAPEENGAFLEALARAL